MSIFGKYGTGGQVPGKYPMPADDTTGSFSLDIASGGTESGTPDSCSAVVASTFGSSSHNPPNSNPKAST